MPLFPSESNSTSVSLLQRVRLRDAQAWERLCLLYGPIVYGWCCRAGLQHDDAADAMQEVFRAVFGGIGDFRGGPTPDERAAGAFRSWLWSITRNQIRAHFRRLGKTPQAIGGSDAQQRFSAEPDAAAAFLLEDEAEPEPADTHRRIVAKTLELIRNDFKPATWEAFTRVVLNNESPQEAAARLNMTENAVRQAKFRVLRRLRDELDGQL